MGLRDWLNPGSAIGERIALNGIEGSLAAAYIAAYLDEDEFNAFMEQLPPEQAEELGRALNALGIASDALDLVNDLKNIGPQFIISELISGYQSAKNVTEVHRDKIEEFAEHGIPGFKKIEFEVNGKPVELYIDASAKTDNHGNEYGRDTEYYAQYKTSDMTSAEIAQINAQIAEHIHQAEREAGQASSYEVGIGMLRIYNPELADNIASLNEKGLGTCLPITENGPTYDSPAACADLNMRNGGMY